jgi:hypothetical protein
MVGTLSNYDALTSVELRVSNTCPAPSPDSGAKDRRILLGHQVVARHSGSMGQANLVVRCGGNSPAGREGRDEAPRVASKACASG